MRIAIASSDEKNVDLHFGKARAFCIFDFDEDGNNKNFVERRIFDFEHNCDNCPSNCKNMERKNLKFQSTEKHQWMKTLNAIRDADIIICVQAGFKAKMGIEEAGIKLVEDEGPIEAVLNSYIEHYKFMKAPL